MTLTFKVHFALYSLTPFLVIAISNFSLIFVIYRKKTTMSQNLTSKDQKSRHDRMNMTVFLMTFLFIGMTSPIAMASFFFETLATTDSGNFVIVLVDFISFCYHGLSFLIMALTNKLFYNECLKVFGREKKELSIISLSRSISRNA
jgi:hypothetical protein